MPRRLKCSAILLQRHRQVARPLGLRACPACASTTLKCFADGGMCVTMSLSNVMMPTRSRWRCARYARHAADVAAVFQLRNPAAGELHRLARCRAGPTGWCWCRPRTASRKAIGPREQPPVDAADVVAGDVAAVLGEVDRRAEERRAVQAVDEAFDDGARQRVRGCRRAPGPWGRRTAPGIAACCSCCAFNRARSTSRSQSRRILCGLRALRLHLFLHAALRDRHQPSAIRR
mgnify:CR=1 FL=1